NLEYECSLDGTPFAPCTSFAEYTDLELGEHDFEVRAEDGQGNLDPTPARHLWTIVAAEPDASAPETTIDSGPDLTTVSTDAELEFSSNEDDTTFECSLDGEAFVACTSPARYEGLAVGDHTFAVRSTDQSGNTDL